MNNPLFNDSDDAENDLELNTNKDYAKSYNNFRKKELLKKFKDRGYDAEESDDSSSSSESSDENEGIDAKFDKEFFKTLASLKSKDPAIYDKKTRFFETAENDDDDAQDSTKQERTKSVTLKEYERKVLLEKGGKFDDSDEGDVDDEHGYRAASPTVAEEEQRLKAEFRQVLNAEDSDEEEFGGIFKKREKTKAEQNKEDDDFAKWLAGKNAVLEKDLKKKLEPLKNYWNSQNLPQSERFLRDYILNQGYADANASEIPTYEEIVGDNAPLSEDEQELEKQAEFEHKYNFRFEEPDEEFIQRHPRTIESSVRRTDEKRKLKRQEVKERKQQEKEQKMKEFELIKEMKRKEIEEKIRKLKAVTGNDELGFKDDELEEDFDPEAHDRRMQELFNDEYYQVDEGEEKPKCPSDIEELEIEDWDSYDPRGGGNENGDESHVQHCEDDDFNMDCDYDPAAAKAQFQQELIENTRRKGRKGRKSQFMDMIQAVKPVFNPDDEKTYADYIDEYYKIDCEDVVGDVPCRFKYVETTPNDFGLTIEEILLAKNKELNQWASLKKATQIRPDYVEKKEQRLYKMKSKNSDLKRKIFKSIYGDGSDDEQAEATPEEDSTKSKTNVQLATEEVPTGEVTVKKSKKRRKRKAQSVLVQHGSAEGSTGNDEGPDDSEAMAKKPKLEETAEKVAESTITLAASTSNAPAKQIKKKKKKKNNKNKIQPGSISSKGGDTVKEAGPLPTKLISGTPSDIKNPFKNKKKNTSTIAKTANSPVQEVAKAGLTKGASSDINNPFKGKQKTDTGEQRHVAKGVKGNKFKTRFQRNASRTANGTQINDDRLKSYGINPRRFQKKQQYANRAK